MLLNVTNGTVKERKRLLIVCQLIMHWKNPYV